MEHYDGPAFYRKYNISKKELKRQQPEHVANSEAHSATQRHDNVRKETKEQPLVAPHDNPIAKRTAAFKPTRPVSNTSQVEQYYQTSMSNRYSRILNQLERSNDQLIYITNDDTGAIDLSETDNIGAGHIALEMDQATTVAQDNDYNPETNNQATITTEESIEQHHSAVSQLSTAKANANNDGIHAQETHVASADNVSEHRDDYNHDDSGEVAEEESPVVQAINVAPHVSSDKHEDNNADNNNETTGQDTTLDTQTKSDLVSSDETADDETAVKTTSAPNASKHGLGNSLSNVLQQENDVKKDLPIFNEEHNEEHQVTTGNESKGYQFPSLKLLSPADKFEDGSMDDWIANQAEKLDETLKAFHVHANVVDWTNGPTVTQFQIKLQLGVKVSKITNLTDDLKLALAAKDIRIEAPIPGKTTVGIEIPNPKPRAVKLAEVLDTPQFKNNPKPLTVALGVDLTGQPKMADLGKMPHGLIAGATGSGKSVFLNSLLISLLYKATPADLKMILIDPKAVEMAPYDKLPHLLSPVISDPKQAAAALKWAVKEMDERYEKLAAAGARNIEQFNKMAADHNEYGMHMPYIVIVIDELADLMMVASNEVQDYIVRITQKARAAGLHLIVATQRPSVDIITGTIKNNIPTRVAFMVSSQVDSRTIIDTAGAERLLGRGDMLYLGNGASQSVRLQGTFVTNQEIEAITNEVRKQGTPHYAFQPESLLKSVNQVEQQDDLMPEVLKYISDEDTVSTSKLQRVFSIGYNRAASLIDYLEQHNYVSGQHGSKPRDVYLTKEDYKKLNIQKNHD
jgi:DNA segregation ATPase FtsK/SpoIIIE, S-DNA-T family